MPSGPPEFIPPFIPVTGVKCSYGKISSPLTEIKVGKTEISGTDPARPLIWTHRKFYKGFRGEARSRKPGQPGQPGSYEEALRLTKQQLCTCIKLFCTFPRHCTTTTWKCLISRFCGGREHKAMTFFFFFWTSIQSFRIQLQKKLPSFDELNERE